MSTRPSSTRLSIVTILAILIGIAASSAPAQAAGATSATCTSLFTITITPGWSMTPTSGTVTTHGETGSVTCVGKIDGQSVSGAGTIGIDETYTNVTCPSSIITGVIRLTIPTTAGIKHMEGALRVRRIGLVVQPEADFPSAHFSGIGVATPTKGTCFLTPLKQAQLSVTGTLSGT
jgi:hypothetical protein